ncbi:MAG TPA: SRPBCC family protein [Solirubrobacteraceae bacterium]|nr:SRPBCC family protein [Solirubrobacteraceae bacterium]
MNEFEIVTRIERPREVVFAAITAAENIPAWTPGLEEVLVAGRPLGPGTEMTFIGRFLGRRYESVSECVALEPGVRFATASRSGPFHLEVEQTLRSEGEVTVLTSHYQGDSRAFFKLAEPIVLHLARRLFESANANLKALIEADAL